MTIGGPCRACGVEHDKHLSDLPYPGDSVVVTAGEYVGETGTVLNWSVYGGPMYYRLQFDDSEAGDSNGRGNVAPCELALRPLVRGGSVLAFLVPYPSGWNGQTDDDDEERSSFPSSARCRWGCTLECDCEERIVCPKAGQPMHWACGWCDVHAGPRFNCLCKVPR